MADGDLLIGAIKILTLLTLIMGIAATLSLLWSRRDFLFSPRHYREQGLLFGAATEVLDKVILDFAYVNTPQIVDNQLSLINMVDRLRKYAVRPFLGSDLRVEMNKLRQMVETKLNTAAKEFPLGESAWPENAIQWGRADILIVDQYLLLLDKTADQLQIDPSSFRDIEEYLIGVRQKLDRIHIPNS